MSNSNWMDDLMNMLSSKVVEPKVVEPEVEKSSILDMFASINSILGTAPMTPREQADSITTSITESKTVVKAEQPVNYVVTNLSVDGFDSARVYDTIDDLVVPDTNCTHYWHIPSIGTWQIGVCSYCNGEKWFSNSYSILMQEQPSFNNSPFTLPGSSSLESLAEKQAMKDIAAIEKSLLDTELAGGLV